MTDLLRIALKGTIATNCEGDEWSVLHHAGIAAMQRMGGYIAPTMPVAEVTMPLPDSGFADVSNYMMMAFLDNFFVPKGNPSAPFMLMVWIYIGVDNEFRLAQSIKDKVLIRHIVFMLLAIICGSAPTTRQIKVAKKYAKYIRVKSTESFLRIGEAIALTLLATCEVIRNTQNSHQDTLNNSLDIGHQVTTFVDNAVFVASFYGTRNTPRQIKGAIQARAIKWMTLTEAEQLQIVREWLLLLLDDR